MKCGNCGNDVPEGGVYCNACGQPVQPNYQQPNYPQPNYQQPNYQQPNYQQPNYQQPYYQQPYYPQPQNTVPYQGMGWFKFLIYFALFFGAFVNLMTGISFLTGSIYGGDAEWVYAVYDGLQSLDMILGCVLICIAAFGVFVRFRLSGYYRNGPAMLMGLYGGVVLFDLVYIVGVGMILPEYVMEEIDFTSTYSAMITGVIMIFVNRVYFKKREHLFVKQ